MADRSGKWRCLLTVAVAITAISAATEASANQSISSSDSFGTTSESTPVFTEHWTDLEVLTGRTGGGDDRDDESDDRGGKGDDKDKGGGGHHGGGTPNPSPTPEPSTILLLATGIAWAAGTIRRRPGR